MKTRIEVDSLGEVTVPAQALWGAQTQRSLQNFVIGRETFPIEFIQSFAQLKKAAAVTNHQLGKLDKTLCDLIVAACDEILAGKHDAQFPLVIWQTGSGTQTNMNLNEVIANCANELAGAKRGSKSPVHPNDHVNLSQSSNDTFPTAMNMTIAQITTRWLQPALQKLIHALAAKQLAFATLIKSGRTHLMDATPITLGQEFSGYVAQLRYAEMQLQNALPGVYALAIGGSAVGTGLNTLPAWASAVSKQISLQTGLPFTSAENKFAALASHDALTHLHGQLKLLATSLFKIASDLRLMASGPRCGLNEIQLPSNEPGSSIMPGKVNPTQIEALTMVAAQVLGNDVTVSFANSQGQFELNVFKPVILRNLFHSVQLLSDAINSFTDHCIVGLQANAQQLQTYVDNSLMLVTALTPRLGYDTAATVAKVAQEKGISLKQAVIELGLMDAASYDAAIVPGDMLGPR